MKPYRTVKFKAGIWEKDLRKVPKNMRWNEYKANPVGRNTIKQSIKNENKDI